MKHIKLFQESVAFSDPFYGNDVFKIRYRALGDLADKSPSGSIEKPENDLLDDFQEGDQVAGEGLEDGEQHTGEVVNIKKDEAGENIEISIEENGEIIKLKTGSVKMQIDGEKGNKKFASEPTDVGNASVDMQTFQPFTYENNNTLKRIKSYSDFK